MKNRLDRLIRICLCGILTGVMTALVILLYKVCAGTVISASAFAYEYIRNNLYLLPVAIFALGCIAAMVGYVYKKWSYLQGGGIPTSIGILRGIIKADWRKSLAGTFVLSVASFAIGVPLGNEGPSVQMGTAVGTGAAGVFAKSRGELKNYAMTGGACAGFSAATGAPISGILFAIEEVYGQFSPMVLLAAVASVTSARGVLELLAPVCGVEVALFPRVNPIILSVYDLWLPLLVGVTMGLFSVVFLKYYDLLHRFWGHMSKRCSQWKLIFAVYALTLIAGLCSFSFVSTGHDLILQLFDNAYIMPLLLLLLVRTILSLSANTVGITGGVFVPVLAIGALVSAILGYILRAVFGLSEHYALLVLLLGICACVAGTMRMPLAAIVFAVEALSCHNNLLAVLTVAVTAFGVTELFGAKSINEHVLERKLAKMKKKKTAN